MGSAGTPLHQELLLLLTQQTPTVAWTYQQVQQQQQQQQQEEEEAWQQVALVVVLGTAACSWSPCHGWRQPLLEQYRASCTAPTAKHGWGPSTGQVRLMGHR